MSETIVVDENEVITIEQATTGPQGPAGTGLPGGGSNGQFPQFDNTVPGNVRWHTLLKNDLGLGNVDNTSDINKPVSNAVAAALSALDAAKSNVGHTHTSVEITDLGATISAAIQSAAKSICVTVGSQHADYTTDGTNDQDEINAAIQAVATAGGGIVWLKDPLYSISASINPKPRVWLRGAGMFMTTLKATSTLSGSPIADTSSFSPAAPLEGFIVTDMEIDGTDMPRAPYSIGRKGIDSKYWRHCMMANLYVHDVPATGLGVDNLDRVLIDHCIVKNCGTSGQAQGSNGVGIGTGGMVSESFIVTNCITEGTANSAYLCEELDSTTTNRHYIFANNLSYGDFKGVSISGASDVLIAGNQIYNPQDDGIRAIVFSSHTASRVTIANNEIDGAVSEAIYIDTGVIGSIISGNRIMNGTIESIVVRGSNTTINGNNIREAGKTSIFVGAASGGSAINNVLLTNNMISNSANVTANTDAIRIDVTSAPISDVTILGNRCFDDQTTKTQRYGLIVTGSQLISRLLVIANNFNGNKTGDYLNNASNGSNTVTYRNNAGQTQSAAYPLSDLATTGTADATTFLRGDAAWTALTKTTVGLGNVDNTSDINKPVSTAQQTALDGKSNVGHTHAITDTFGLQTALDNKLDDSQLDTDSALAANSDSKIASQKAVKNYVDGRQGSTVLDAMRKRPVLFSDFLTQTSTAAVDPFVATAVGTGAALAAPNSGLVTAQHPGVIRVRCGTTANSGIFLGTNTAMLLIGGGEVFETCWNPTAFANNLMYVGFQDSASTTEAADGAYFAISSTGVVTAKTASNSTRSSSGTTYTLTAGNWYRFKVVMNTAGTQADFFIYDDSGTQLWTESLNTNIPTASGRETGAGIWAYNSGTTATDMYHVDSMALTWSTDRTR